MSVRGEMVDIIARCRDMIADPNGEQFDDETIQTILDEHARTHLLWAMMKPVPFIEPGGLVTFRTFVSPLVPVAKTATLYDATYSEITPETSDYMRGIFSFAQDKPEPMRPVMIVADAYDINLACATLCRIWASRVKSDVSFKDPNFSLSMKEQYDHLIELANAFLSKSPPTTIHMRRGDTVP